MLFKSIINKRSKDFLSSEHEDISKRIIKSRSSSTSLFKQSSFLKKEYSLIKPCFYYSLFKWVVYQLKRKNIIHL